MKTKEYRIKLTADSRDHKKLKRQVEALYKSISKELAGDMEFYVDYKREPKQRPGRLYNLGSGEVLHFAD